MDNFWSARSSAMSDFHVRKFKKDQRVFNVGSRGDAAYILRSGSVEISVEKVGKKVVLAVLTPPVVFGEMALLLDESVRTATAITVEESELIILERDQFNEYLSNMSPVMAHVVEHLAQRVKETSMRAARTADAFMGICTLINSMALMIEEEEINYQTLSDTASAVFVLSNEETHKLLDIMESLGLFTIEGDTQSTKVIEIEDEETFLEQAQKVYEIAKSLGNTQV
jgi:CRP/FNR family cyclic AMP-dependent transcriptional regulator